MWFKLPTKISKALHMSDLSSFLIAFGIVAGVIVLPGLILKSAWDKIKNS